MNREVTLYRTTRAVWFVFGIIETLLLFRFVLRLLGANPGAAFTDLIYSLTAPLVWPFQFVFETPALGGSALELGTVLALIVYWVLAWGIVELMTMNRPVSQLEAHQELRQQDTP